VNTPPAGSTRLLGAVTRTHADPTGHRWRVTVHWASVDGAAVPVGLDLRAFEEDDNGIRPTGGVLTAAVLRSLRVGELIEQARREGAWNTVARPATPAAAVPAPRRPRRGRPADRGDDFVAEVAGLYHEAKAQGGEPARKPWRYVADRLRERGLPDVTDGQLKNWSRRAKNLGLLPATGRRRPKSRREKG
jgi:hypothetical protein